MNSLVVAALVVIVALVLSQKRAKTTTDRRAQSYFDEGSCLLVSSRGLASVCDVKPPRPVSSVKQCYLSRQDVASIGPNRTVYVPTSALQAFSTMLGFLRHPITLVTGDADETVDGAHFYRKIADSAMIRRWFGQNMALKHPKCVQMPIGLDYHTLANADEQVLPSEQEAQLFALKKKAVSFADRKQLVYANFQFQTKVGVYIHDRRDALAKLPRDIMWYEPSKAPREVCWDHMTQMQFCASPHGNGLDCHRTWEALCLGCVPIVKSSPLDDLYAQLPVMIVRDWSEVTRESLAAFAKTIDDASFDTPLVTLAHWKNRINESK